VTLYFGRLFCEMGSVCCSPVGCAQPEGALIMWVQFPSFTCAWWLRRGMEVVRVVGCHEPWLAVPEAAAILHMLE